MKKTNITQLLRMKAINSMDRWSSDSSSNTSSGTSYGGSTSHDVRQIASSLIEFMQ